MPSSFVYRRRGLPAQYSAGWFTVEFQNIQRALLTAETFTQSGAGAIVRTANDKMAERFSVDDFGGTDDERIAEATLEAAILRATTSDGGLGSGCGPEVWFPPREYHITQDIPAAPYLNYTSDGAMIYQTDPTKDIFTGVSYANVFTGLTLIGGRRQWSIATNNTDTTQIFLDRCQSIGFVGDAIYSDTNSESTQLIVSRHKFFSSETTARICQMQTGDNWRMENSWAVMNSTDEAFRLTAGFQFMLDNVICIPWSGTGCWIRNDGVVLDVRNCRFGAEAAGGRTVLRHYGAANLDLTSGNPVSVHFERNEMYTGSGLNAFEFYALPNTIRIRDNEGIPGPCFVSFDPGITAAYSKLIGGTIQIEIEAAKDFRGGLVPFHYTNNQVVDIARSLQ